MFSKVWKKTVVATAVVAILAMPSSVLALPGLQGRLIAATPYDTRMAQAGILSLSAPLQNFNSIDALFMKARAFRYKEDARGNDHWQSPEETESRWAGDCEDKAVWLFYQLKMNGAQDARLVIGKQNAASKGLHVWVALTEPNGSFRILDPTAQKRIWSSTDLSAGSYRPLYSFDGINRYRHDAE